MRKSKRPGHKPSVDTCVQGFDSEKIIRWLRFSRHLRDQADTKNCIDAISALLEGEGVELASDMLAELEAVGKNVLRRARVRIDCVCMLLWQLFFQSIDLAELNICVHIDGSPMHRSQELLASVLDVFVGRGGEFRRTLILPIINLGHENLDAVGKAVTFLWQMLLVTGPLMLRPVLNRIRAFNTDNGTERRKL